MILMHFGELNKQQMGLPLCKCCISYISFLVEHDTHIKSDLIVDIIVNAWNFFP